MMTKAHGCLQTDFRPAAAVDLRAGPNIRLSAAWLAGALLTMLFVQVACAHEADGLPSERDGAGNPWAKLLLNLPLETKTTPDTALAQSPRETKLHVANGATSDPALTQGRVVDRLALSRAATNVEHEEKPLLLEQFYLTNPRPSPPRTTEHSGRQAASPMKNEPLGGRRIRLPLSSVISQWTMSTNAYSQPGSATHVTAPVGTAPETREEEWTVSVPTVINPFTQRQDLRQPETATGTVLAAYQEEAEEELPAPPELQLDGPGQPTRDARQNVGEESGPLAEAERLGEEPEDTSLQFLRTSTVLLKPGESQFDIGITYLLSENSFPILLVDEGDPVGAEDVDFRIRELTVPMQYRFGVLERVQAYIGMPVGWSNTQVAIDSFEAFQNDGGIGDIDFGATVQLIDGNAEKSHMLMTVSATAPTGSDPFGATAALASSSPSLGQGFWSIAGNVLCIKTYDPLVFYYGVGTEHYIGRDFRGLEIDPGASWNYRFGVGFAVNDRVTLSTRFQGAYIEEIKVERKRVFGSNIEPMSIRMAATISKPCNRLVEPFVEFGLTEGSIASYFGVTWTF